MGFFEKGIQLVKEALEIRRQLDEPARRRFYSKGDKGKQSNVESYPLTIGATDCIPRKFGMVFSDEDGLTNAHNRRIKLHAVNRALDSVQVTHAQAVVWVRRGRFEEADQGLVCSGY